MNIHDLQKYSCDEIRAVISTHPGIYIWWRKGDDFAPIYIGSATNRCGLLGRVVRQHLRPTYLELRTEKTEKAPVVTMYKGRRAIEKSVFRKKIAFKFGVMPGSQCVEFIMENFLVSVMPLPDTERNGILEIERGLIAAYKPVYNTKVAPLQRDTPLHIARPQH